MHGSSDCVLGVLDFGFSNFGFPTAGMNVSSNSSVHDILDGNRLTQDDLAAYRRDGFLVRTAVFNESELQVLRQAVESAVALAKEQANTGKTYLLDGKRFVDVDVDVDIDVGVGAATDIDADVGAATGIMTVQFEHSPGSETVRVIEPVQHLHPALDRLVDEQRIVAPICDIIDCTEVSVWTNKLNLKRPREGSGFGWHQDAPYWIHDCDHVHLLPSVYLAFDDADEDNGCLQIIRGSHTQGCLPGSQDDAQLAGFFTQATCFDEADAVSFEIPAGSLIFFDPYAIHGSQTNHSDQPRRAIVMTYQPANFGMLKTGEVRNVAGLDIHR